MSTAEILPGVELARREANGGNVGPGWDDARLWRVTQFRAELRNADAVLAGLDDEQRAAVTAPAGPVCILAGAGTGKTRAITHRIAYRVLTGEIEARHVLAVTFTARAAAQMRARLAELGVPPVQARTFHAAALRQLRYFAERLLGGPVAARGGGEQGPAGRTLAARPVGVRTDRTGARDLAERDRVGQVEPDRAGRLRRWRRRRRAGSTPQEPAKVAEVYAAYEQVKRSTGVIDFEDLLRAAVWGIEEHPDVAEQIRAQYRHFVVDEYQDVNPAQQRLLQRLAGRARRPDRGRRRQPDHLLVHRGQLAAT